jgi:hypothetical protein
MDTLAFSRPPFIQGCMLLAEPNYLSYSAPMKVVVACGPLIQVQTLLPQAPPMVVHHQVIPDQLVL